MDSGQLRKNKIHLDQSGTVYTMEQKKEIADPEMKFNELCRKYPNLSWVMFEKIYKEYNRGE